MNHVYVVSLLILLVRSLAAVPTATLTTLGATTTELIAIGPGARNTSTSAESTLAQLYCNAMLASNTPGQSITICVINGGALQSNVDAGPIDTQMLSKAYPFEDTVVRLLISGDALTKMLNHGVTGFPTEGRFPQVGNMRFAFLPLSNFNSPTGFDTAVVTAIIESGGKMYSVGGTEPIIELVTNSYLASGNDGYSMLQEAQVVLNTTRTVNDIVGEYLGKNTPVTINLTGRIVNCISQAGDPLCTPGAGMVAQTPPPASEARQPINFSLAAVLTLMLSIIYLWK